MLRQLSARRNSLQHKSAGRKNFARKNLCRSFESLEPRQVMAGNVTAIVDGAGQLLITGDSAANGIYLSQVGQGQFEVRGFDADGAATTINGSNMTLTLSGVTGNISIVNGNGDDIVQLDYLNHQGNLRIDALEGHDLINIGTSNKVSNLVGNIELGFAQSHVVNLLNTNFVGKLTTQFTGPQLFTATNSAETASLESVPLVNSYAITGCSFSSDVSIQGRGRAIQAFVESTHINGELRIQNGTGTLSGPPSLTQSPSFIVLNNVSAKTGLEVELFSSTSFVMNNCVIDSPEPLPDNQIYLVSQARISLYGKTNIYQISNSVFKGSLETSNSFYDPSHGITNVYPPRPLEPSFKSTYDIIQLNNVTCEHVATLVSNGTLSVKHSEFDKLYVVAKKVATLNDVQANDAAVTLSNLTGRTTASILGSTFENLTVTCNVRNLHSFNVKVIDTTVTGITSITGRGDLEVTSLLTGTVAPVISTAAANILIEKSTFGTFYYSFYVSDFSPPTDTGQTFDGLPLIFDLNPRTEAETYLGLYGGSGSDNLTIRESTIDKFFAQLGAGDDSLTFQESKILTDGLADGSTGTDKLTTDNDANISKASFINFENAAGSPGGTMTIGGGLLDVGGTIVINSIPNTMVGTFTLAGMNTGYSGKITISSGTLTVGGNGNLIVGSGAVGL